jgi:hypothetical protein
MPGSAAPYIEFRIVAVAGTTPLYLNNVYVGPGIITQGPAVSGWQTYTPTVNNLSGFSTAPYGYWRRVGDSVECVVAWIKNASAGVSASVVTVSIPPGLTADTTKISPLGTVQTLGVTSMFGAFVANFEDPYSVTYQSTTTVSISRTTTANNALGNQFLANGTVSMRFTLPIAEWADGTINLLSSTVTEANAGLSVEGLAAAAITINTAARFNTTKLLRGSITYSSATGGFTVPVSDFYSVRAQVFGPFNGTPRLVLRNTTDSIDLFSGTTGPTTLGPETGALIDCTVQLVTGKTYAIIVTGGSYTYYTGDVFNNLQVHRVPQYNTSAPVGFGKADSSNSGFVNPRKGQTTLIISGTGWSVTRAVGIYYQDQDGNHRLKFNIAGSCAATTAFTGTITGVTFFNVTSFGQAISATIGEAGIAARATLNAYVSPNAGTFFVSSVSGNFTFLTLSGDVELASKPSWA